MHETTWYIPIYNFISDSKVGRPNASPYPFFAYMPIYFLYSMYMLNCLNLFWIETGKKPHSIKTWNLKIFNVNQRTIFQLFI